MGAAAPRAPQPIAGSLREIEAWTSRAEVCRRSGVIETTLFQGKTRQGVAAAPQLDQRRDLAAHDAGVERPGDVLDRTLGVALGLVLLVAVHRGPEHDRHVAGPVASPQVRRGLEPVHAWYLNVEQDRGEAVVVHQLERPHPRRRPHQLRPERLERGLEREQVALVVVDQHHARGGRLGRSIVVVVVGANTRFGGTALRTELDALAVPTLRRSVA